MKTFKEKNNFKQNLFNIGVFLLVLVAFGLSFLTFGTKKVNAEGEAVTVSSLSEITDMSGNYALNKDQEYTYTASLGSFAGSLNGNGAKIVFEGTSFVPLFNSITTNAIVKNLQFANGEEDDNITYTIDVTNGTSYGLLAGTILGGNVYGVEFNNINLVVYDNESNTAVSQLNVGLVAGQVKGGKVHQIKITNCNILPYKNQLPEQEEVTIGIRPSLNLGLLVGSASEGALFQNNLINNNGVSVVIAEAQSNNFNFGGLLGLLDSGFVTNNIINFTINNSYDVEFNRTNKSLNFGYLVGKCGTNMVSLINNVINVRNDAILAQDEENFNLGLYVGYMPTTIESDYIDGILTTNDAQYAGNILNENFTYKYKNIKYILNENLISTNIKDTTLWNDTYAWNFDKIWRETNEYIPTLQIFEEYAVTFSSVDSVKSLGIENLPTLPNNADVVVSNITADQIAYGSTLTISAKVTTENNFDKFFYVVGLRLNGNEIYNFQTNKSADGFSVSGEMNESGEATFAVKDINSSNAGTYSVQLARKTYKIKLKVYELTIDDQTFIPGKVKNNMASVAYQEIVVDMKYGEKFTYETYDVNSDYAKEADWYLSYISKNQEDNPSEEDNTLFNLEKEKAKTVESEKLACFDASRTLTWTFTENSTLFGYSKSAEDEHQYLNINNYNYDENDADTKMFVAYVVFTRDVKDIEIVFKYDDDEIITDKIADVIIDDGAVTVTYKNGVFVTKIRYGTKPHTITLRQLSTDYTFDGWYLNSRLGVVAGDEYAGSFEIQNDGDTNTVVLNAVFIKSAKKSTNNLLWLWITLGGVALVGIVVTIIIVKKKKSGDSGYKKYMY